MPTDYTEHHYAFGLYEKETLIGGLTAKESVGELNISLLEYRHQGLGRLLVEAAEAKARERSYHHILLTTYNYQGLHFYLKLGYTQLAEIPNYPIFGVEKFYFIKYLSGVKNDR